MNKSDLIDFKLATIILTFLTINKPRPYSSKDLSEWINENNLHLRKDVSPKSISKIIKNKSANGMTRDIKTIKNRKGNLYYIKE